MGIEVAPQEGTPVPPDTPLRRANVGMSKARQYRGNYLVSVAQGLLTAMDVVLSATEERGRPLRRLNLFTVLTAEAGVGPQTARAIIDRLVRFAPESHPDGPVTVGWVVENAAAGRRITALADAMDNQNRPAPWKRYPYAPDPNTQEPLSESPRRRRRERMPDI